jgi:hypothetical protein
MAIRIRRREFIATLGGVGASWPLAARAQQPVIGWLGATSPTGFQPYLSAFRQGLGEQGYVPPSQRYVGRHLEFVLALVVVPLNC